MTAQKAVKVRCSHPGCNTPVAEWQGRVLLIEATHHGDKEKHRTVLYLPLDFFENLPNTKH